MRLLFVSLCLLFWSSGCNTPGGPKGPPLVKPPGMLNFVPLPQMPQSSYLSVISNIDLSQGSAAKGIIVMVHGNERDAAAYFDVVETAAIKAGISLNDFVILAPRFTTQKDIQQDSLPTSTAAWDFNGWKEGQGSVSPIGSPDVTSSFSALDDLLQYVSDPALCPLITQIVVAGFSAGGQYVQRYAVLSSAEETFKTRGISMRYVVAAPSSFLYFNALRPITAQGPFEEVNSGLCSNVNQYKYGLENRISYGQDIPMPPLLDRYLQRGVVYLEGSTDEDPHLAALDKTCAAQAQGASHLERGKNYVRHLQSLSTNASLSHTFNQIAGASHSATQVFGSSCGAHALFFKSLCPTQDPSSG